MDIIVPGVEIDQTRKIDWKENTILISLFSKEIPFVYPRLSDPRILQITTLVVFSVLGQLVYRFNINFLQIILVVFTSIVLDIYLSYRAKKILLFPASGLISGLSLGLLLRVVEGPSMYAIYVLAGILAIGSKYLINIGKKHIFNPSNFAIFFILYAFNATTFVAPLQWQPSLWLIIFICSMGFFVLYKARVVSIALVFLFSEILMFIVKYGMKLFENPNNLFISFFSPSLLIFTFFMITDPRTVPRDKTGKILYAFLVGVFHWVFLSCGLGQLSLFLALFLVCAAVPFIDILTLKQKGG